MAEWARVVNTTTREYIKGEQNNVMRNRKLTALMQERGRVSFNHSGESLDWKVRYMRSPMSGYADADTLTFSRQNKWKTATLPWRGYATTDSITKKESLMNKGTPQIVKLYGNIAKLLLEDIEDQFASEWYSDGNTAGNKGIHGVESFFGINGTVTITDGTERSANAADRVGSPQDSYAGLNTDLGDRGGYGGTWTGSWPQGTGQSHFDFFSPLVVASDSSDFGGAADTWAAQGDEVLRYAIIKSQKNKSRKGQADLCLMEGTMYEQLLNILDSKERFIARPGRVEGSLAKLGFSDSFSRDGVEVSWEYGIPSDTAYGFNVDEMELCSLQSQLFVPEGPDFAIETQSYRYSLDFFGQLKCNPRSQFKIAVLT